MVRVADCKSVVARLSRFNSYLSHQCGPPCSKAGELDSKSDWARFNSSGVRQLKGKLIMDKEMFIQLIVGITAAIIIILGGSYLVLLLPLPPF